jgi:hypothetical protein
MGVININIIISSVTQRTGSTMLQRIINTRKENLIWGEHNFFVSDFVRVYKKLLTYSNDNHNERKRYFSNNEDPNTWIARMSPEVDFLNEAIIKSLRVFLDELYSKGKYNNREIVGVKEVNYGREELVLLRKCYPEAIFLLLFRNPINIWESLINCSWYDGNIETFVSKWHGRTSEYLQLLKVDKNSKLIRYEDIVSRDKVTLDLISIYAKISHSQIENVLKNKIVGSGIITSPKKYITKKETCYIIDKCAKLMEKLKYLQ